MENEIIHSPSYTSLTQIRAKKEAVRKQIVEEEDKVRVLWDKLFTPNDKENTSPSKRISDMVSTGISVADTLILGWKLYRKFTGKPLLKFKSWFCNCLQDFHFFKSNDAMFCASAFLKMQQKAQYSLKAYFL